LSCEWCERRDATSQCGECDARVCGDCWYDHAQDCAEATWDEAERYFCEDCGADIYICPFCENIYCGNHFGEHLAEEIESRGRRIIRHRKVGLARL